jgi:hypothetical protein
MTKGEPIVKMNPKQVADFLGVSNHSLRYYRDPSRLPDGVDNPLYLPATPDESNRNLLWYDVEDVHAFVVRNEKFRDRIIASQASPEVYAEFAPQLARALAMPQQTTPEPSGLGLLGGLTTTPITTQEEIAQ